MPIIRTTFRPWEELDVSAEEAASMERMGLLSATGSVEPGPAAETETEPAAAAEPPAPKTGRRAKTTTTAAAEEVNTDGSSEEGGQEGSAKQEG